MRHDRIDDSVAAFARLFAAHAAHLFEFCHSMTDSGAAAADATVAALACREHLPQASHLLRARLFAIARQVAMASAQAEEPWLAESGVGDSPDTQGDTVLVVLGHLPARHREVLALVYRHGIWPEQLPGVLGVSVREAYERLAAAEYEFVSIAAVAESVGTAAAAHPALEDMATLPLAAVPGPVWRRAVAELAAETAGGPAISAAAAALPDRWGGSRTRSRPRQRRGLQLAAAAALPVVAIGSWAIATQGGSPRPADSIAGAGPALGRTPASSPSAATPDGVGTGPTRQSSPPSGQGTAPARRGATPTVPIIALLPSTPPGTVLPIASPSGSVGTAGPALTAQPSSSAPSGSPSPSDSASPSASPDSPSPSDSTSAAPSPSDSPTSATPSTAAPAPTG
jgi:DNA-directed RNA polymerase specialized sigma24 family protein